MTPLVNSIPKITPVTGICACNEDRASAGGTLKGLRIGMMAFCDRKGRA